MSEQVKDSVEREAWIEPEVVEMSAQCSAARSVSGSDGASGTNYHRS